MKQFGYANYREQVGAVLQDDHLFAGSIAGNIALFEDAPDMQRIVGAAAATCSAASGIAEPIIGEGAMRTWPSSKWTNNRSWSWRSAVRGSPGDCR